MELELSGATIQGVSHVMLGAVLLIVIVVLFRCFSIYVSGGVEVGE